MRLSQFLIYCSLGALFVAVFLFSGLPGLMAAGESTAGKTHLGQTAVIGLPSANHFNARRLIDDSKALGDRSIHGDWQFVSSTSRDFVPAIPKQLGSPRGDCAFPSPRTSNGKDAQEPQLAQCIGDVCWVDSDGTEWYCNCGDFCCGSVCCTVGENCCSRHGGCCPASAPVSCGGFCYVNQFDAEADGCTDWEICAAPVQ